MAESKLKLDPRLFYEAKEFSIGSVNGNSSGSKVDSIAKDGYSLFAFFPIGTNHGDCIITECYRLSGNRISVSAYNLYSAAQSITARVGLLYYPAES